VTSDPVRIAMGVLCAIVLVAIGWAWFKGTLEGPR
jgi:hypothetical protein